MSDSGIESDTHFAIRVAATVTALLATMGGCASLIVLPIGLTFGHAATALFAIGVVAAIVGYIFFRAGDEPAQADVDPGGQFWPVSLLWAGGIAILAGLGTHPIHTCIEC